MSGCEWYKDWFDTEYYHLLYNKRDDDEACNFIANVTQQLHLEQGDLVADIACGKGRHSRVLADMGYRVCGYDLSINNIAYASAQNSEGARFYVHDIRDPYDQHEFVSAFNLFTSFGYFENSADDSLCIRNIYDMLKPGGFLVQDYLNGSVYTPRMPMNGLEKRGDIVFTYEKQWVPPHIVKEIEVQDRGQTKHFKETVRVYSREELENLHTRNGFVVKAVYGDYNLGVFDAQTSSRIIIISQKPNT